MNTSVSTRHPFPVLVPLLIAAMMTSGCEAVGFIFKAGVWTGVFAVIVVIALAAFAFRAARRS
jgi:hypothetical protein